MNDPKILIYKKILEIFYWNWEKKKIIDFWQKYHFSPYILESQLIWSLYFGSSQFDPSYF